MAAENSSLSIPKIDIQKAKEVYKQQPDDLEPTSTDASTEFQAKIIELRKQRPQWITYQSTTMVDKEIFDLINRYDSANSADREKILNHPTEKLNLIHSLVVLLNKISKESVLQYTVTLIDDMLQESKQRVDLFHLYGKKQKENVYSIFSQLFYRDDPIITNQASRILSKLACWSGDLMPEKDLKDYLTWIKEQLNEKKNIYKETMCRCLQMMLRIDHYRVVFYQLDGVNGIVKYLENTFKNQGKDQIQYQLINCLWLLTFNKEIAQKIEINYTIIPVVADILNATEKEKVKRVTLALFRNLLEKPEDAEIIRANSLYLLQFKVKKLVSIMQQAQIQDQEIVEDIEFLNEKLESLVSDVSSFDEYVAEITCNRLHWSPVHRSDKFWRENAARLNENNFFLIKHLIRLLKDPNTQSQVLEIAAFDLGEYVRYYPRGKSAIEQYDGKSSIMALLTHNDTNVRHQALLCVQKLMVHHWEYLNKNDPTSTSNGQSATTSNNAVASKA